MPLPPLPQPGPNDVWGADLNAFLSALAAQAGTVKSVNGNSGPDVSADEATAGTRLGEFALEIADWNAATAPGWYKGNGAANAPNGDAGWWYGTVEGHDPDWVTQEVQGFTYGQGPSATVSYRYRRFCEAGIWSAWQSVMGEVRHLDARYKNVGEAVSDDEVPPRLSMDGERITNWNVAVHTGWYNSLVGASNTPSNTYLVGRVDGGWEDGTWATQTVWELTGTTESDFRCWRRFLRSGVWGIWQRVYEGQQELDARYKNVGEAVSDAELNLRYTTGQYAISDLNTITHFGVYSAPPATLNTPPAGSGTADYWTVLYQPNTSTDGVMTATLYFDSTLLNGTQVQTWQRTKGGSTWSGWYRVYNTETELDARYAPKAPAINYQSGTAYTLVLSDAGKKIMVENAAANTVTIPPDSAVAFPVNTEIQGFQWGAGQTTIVAGAGVTVNATPGLKVAARYGEWTATKVGVNIWLVTGRLSA